MKTLHSHGATFMFIIFLLYPFLSLAVDTITPTQPLTVNQTLVSNGEVFELGFFSTSKRNRYIGIWYKQIQPITYVWVANRDNPITSGNLTILKNGNMALLNQTGTIFWSPNQSTNVVNTVAQLLDNGNFVLRPENDENPDNYIWQSFDYPTDTLLPEMRLGWDRKSGINRILQSWKSNNDPATGDYSFELDISGFPELVTFKNETIIWRTGPWNGVRFSGVPQMTGVDIMRFELQETSDEISYSFEMLNTSLYSRLVINASGINQRFLWFEQTKSWSEFWSFPGDSCDHYGACGPFGVCDANTAPICNSIAGFQPKNKHAWDLRDGKDGCVRSSKLDCGTDGFLPLKNMKLPESSKAFVDQTMNLSMCGEICKKNCSCAAYANMNITQGGSGCVIWEVDLMDMRRYAADSKEGGQDLYVRVAASDLDQSPITKGSKSGSGKGNRVGIIVGISVSACVALILLMIVVYCMRKNINSLGNSTAIAAQQEGIKLPLFDITTLSLATDNFSDTNILGQGGFGCVYKGTLTDGRVVAVKRLSRVCDQGIVELQNEVNLIVNLQHCNLVRVLGCCIEAEEKLLIYEYMENKSLDMFIFDKDKRKKLSWKIRIQIIRGIARGLLYLHQDSSYKIVHRDMKASNILLDNKMNPKISDFGIARLFENDQTEAETEILVGTPGYMPPEYTTSGQYSTKSDVYSFGVLILEIVSGRRNRLNLLQQARTLQAEKKLIQLLDKSIRSKKSEREVLIRCIQIGLLCVEEQPENRPEMKTVDLLLNSKTEQISLTSETERVPLTSETERVPQPDHPSVTQTGNHQEATPIQEDDTNHLTITILEAR